ncbi:MAG: NAD-dependent epimerase/dehydratase family protein [Ruminococcus sp.]|nr:NAD-dependent epimerase/dehydratase family protein [Ruminococcus sp.]
MKRILITGKGSYIGESVKDFLMQYPESYEVDIIDTIGLVPTVEIFRGYDVVFNAAGIAHIKETKQNRDLYYKVNRDLAIDIAKSAKAAGVKQFILLSTMSVYGMTTGHITKKTRPHPVNAYGRSKLQADIAIKKLSDDTFKFACLRPPMVYGKGCKGNYQLLRKFALISPIFPYVENERSMIYIGNLCEFVKQVIDNERSGLFFPQNVEYVCTSDLVKEVAEQNGKKVILIKGFSWLIRHIPLNIVKKVFGDLTYVKADFVTEFDYSHTILLTEGT